MKSSTKLFWGIIVLALLLLFYLIFTYKEQTFNKYDFGTSNMISNKASVSYLDTIAHVGLDILGIKNHVIVIRDQEDALSLGGDIETQAWVVTQNSMSIIYIKPKLGRNESITTLAHEIIHIDQSRKGRFVRYQPPIILWDNVEYNGLEIPYGERPWEVDAFKRGKELEKQIRDILYE